MAEAARWIEGDLLGTLSARRSPSVRALAQVQKPGSAASSANVGWHEKRDKTNHDPPLLLVLVALDEQYALAECSRQEPADRLRLLVHGVVLEYVCEGAGIKSEQLGHLDGCQYRIRHKQNT